jgi:hypothetical protein
VVFNFCDSYAVEQRKPRANPGDIILSASKYFDDVVCPSPESWGPPGAAVLAWLATHVAAVVVYSAVILSSSLRAHPWRCMVLVAWLVSMSGLVVRAAGELAKARRTAAKHRLWRIWHPSWRPNVKGGLFVMNVFLVFAVIHPLGAGALGGFLAVLALTSGARVAGLEAWADIERSPFSYTRAVFSLRALVVLVNLAVVGGLMLWVMARFLDPHLSGDIGSAERWIGVTFSRRAQYYQLILGSLAMTPPTLVVCEAIGAIGAYGRELNDRLARQERRLQRAEFASTLHDRVVALADEVRVRCADVGHRALALELENELRQLQLEQDDRRDPRPISVCLERGLQMATVSGLHLELNSNRVTLDFELAGEPAWVLERLLLVHVGNSQKAGARNGYLRVLAEAGAIDFTYYDDGPGFDPDMALSRTGGLVSVRNDIIDAGGELNLVVDENRVVAAARLPIGA